MPKRKGPGGYRAAKNYLPRGKGRPAARGRFEEREAPSRAAGRRRSASGRAAARGRDRSAPPAVEQAGPAREHEAVEARLREVERRERELERRERALAERTALRRSEHGRAGRTGERPERRRRERERAGEREGRGRPGPGEDVVLERLAARTITREETEGLSFADLGLSERVVGALDGLGAKAPFPIQAATVPDAIAGRDVLGRGRTGSGKTIAFGAALVERLLMIRPKGSGPRRMGRAPRALVIAPTRELAMQIDRTVQPIARSAGLFTTRLFGGVPQARQVQSLRRGVDVVIGTPGRIEDLHAQGHLDLSEVVVTVLDEADQMCDLGFLEPMQRILRLVKPGGQRLLFSATLDAAVMALVDEFLHDPAVHEVAGESQDHADIDHRVLVVERRDRDAVLQQLAGSGGRVLIFARTRLGAERIAEELDACGVPAVALHGDLSQARRTRNLQQLSRGRVDVLVATDVAARGIHVDDIRLVLQADAPDEYKTYLHRAGRTGRAGKAGTVVTLVPPNRRRRMQALLERAEVRAPMIPAAPGGPELEQFAANG